jgi:hypothetical protein
MFCAPLASHVLEMLLNAFSDTLRKILNLNLSTVVEYKSNNGKSS